MVRTMVFKTVDKGSSPFFLVSYIFLTKDLFLFFYVFFLFYSWLFYVRNLPSSNWNRKSHSFYSSSYYSFFSWNYSTLFSAKGVLCKALSYRLCRCNCSTFSFYYYKAWTENSKCSCSTTWSFCLSSSNSYLSNCPNPFFH